MAGASSTFYQEYNNNSNDLPGRTKGFAYAFVADNATAAFTAHTTAYSFDGALAAVVPFVSSTAGLTYLGVKATQAAGNVEIGENATVSGSLNRPSATSIGDGATANMQPYEVKQPDPVIVPTAQ